MKNFNLLLALICLSVFSFGQTQEKLYSNLSQAKPDFYNSKTKISGNISDCSFEILQLIDKRDSFVGEPIDEKIKVEKFKDYWKKPLPKIFTDKITKDLTAKGLKANEANKIKIQPIVEVLYVGTKGFMSWQKCYTKVRIQIITTKDGAELINKKYETIYITTGSDADYEGDSTDAIETFANTALGICLRKTLDKYYSDLKQKLANPPK